MRLWQFLLISIAFPFAITRALICAASHSHRLTGSCRRSAAAKRGLALRGKREDDFIDVDTGIEFRDTRKGPKVTGDTKETKGGFLSGLAKWFGQDEASLKKKEQKKQINTAIDKMMEGTGLTGKLLGGIMKGVGGMIAEGLADQQVDMQSVNDLIVSTLENDDECSRLLGRGIGIQQVFSSSSSSSSINGMSSKQVNLGLIVSGSQDSASVQASASSGDGKELYLTALTLQFQSTGKIIRVVNSGSGQGGAGGSRRNVIDVKGEVL